MPQISQGKLNRFQRATTEFTASTLDGYGLRDPLPARPAPYASYPVLVHRLASLVLGQFQAVVKGHDFSRAVNADK
jgi:hypothetical protein